MLPPRPAQKRNSELAAAIARCRHALIGIGVFTAAINLLQLTGPLFMLEVYDRVLPGRSIPTLVAISALALVMFAFQGLLDVLRSRVLVRIAASVDETLSQRVFDLATKLPLKAITPPSFQPVHDLDRKLGRASFPGVANARAGGAASDDGGADCYSCRAGLDPDADRYAGCA